eukprot:CAMPEP_0169151998 /NCGR_PEP_ID=MMETSP1015-20121227/51204_1 /TAXON_ID=342587 /ORGANISM="Karlodinium micrum, Strain CCMP2283" /LENGTH=220 /DNA_ID=CAMNT_0009221613 /DNA_START=41 /DNA_END=703 /DNA_ORIENTATION=+
MGRVDLVMFCMVCREVYSWRIYGDQKELQSHGQSSREAVGRSSVKPSACLAKYLLAANPVLARQFSQNRAIAIRRRDQALTKSDRLDNRLGLSARHQPPQMIPWKPLLSTVAILALVVRKVVKSGGLKKYMAEGGSNPKYVAKTIQEEEELHEFVCEKCGYTMFPARGRDGKFFPDDYKCVNCGVSKDRFYDMMDLNDPRTKEARKNDPYFSYDDEKKDK